MNIGAVILAGGRSKRMGRDKAWVEIAGEPLIAHSLRTVRDAGITEIYVSGRAGTDYSSLHCPVLLDRETCSGPLAGIDRGLEMAQAQLVFILAVDLPQMTTEFIRSLVGRCDSLTGVIPKVRGQLEPLAAIYTKRCHYLARECLLRGRLAARDFAEACLHEHAVRIFSVPEKYSPCFENWNTPSDVTNPGN
ncbi:putative molybdenum cofactor guanylyltransferase [Verrucomicrobia bacterium]|nr:putative molybdenum cofactor guanylyltransferase [Verrucomicrobiota bacterium]